MSPRHGPQESMSLFSETGERKYLNAAERKRFRNALPVITEPSERTFCETIYWTGCRPSEALELVILRVNVEEASLVFKTLKKHGGNKGRHFRIVPIPSEFARRLNTVHGILKAQMKRGANLMRRLWRFGRQKGWNLVRAVMSAAKIFGIRACARGLRHSFGVHAILASIPEIKLQTWMGHASLSTTAIYVNLIGAEDREIASRMWKLDGVC